MKTMRVAEAGLQTRLFVLALLAAASVTVSADMTALAGNWIGQVTTASLGDMDVALELRMEKDKLAGAVKTSHGGWPVASVVEKDGVYTVTFTTENGPGTMTGRIDAGRFAGDWQNPMASGKFSLARSKKP